MVFIGVDLRRDKARGKSSRLARSRMSLSWSSMTAFPFVRFNTH